MRLNIYLILLIVLLIFNLIFWVLVIWFRIFYDCDGSRSRRATNSRRRGSSGGHSNPGFNDQEDPARTPQRPFTIPEAMESPPSYEEALKYDQFGFRIAYPQDAVGQRPAPQNSSQRHTVPKPYQVMPEAVMGSSLSSSSAEEPLQVMASNSVPSTSIDVRPNSSTFNHDLSSPLSTISEEDDSPLPITLVIDCIGVQAARLMENCDTTVNLTNGQDLGTHSKC